MSSCKDMTTGKPVNLDTRRMACDREHDYYCGKNTNYEDVYAEDSLEDCLKYHCCDQGIQDVPDLNCELDNVNLDIPFQLYGCFPKGWVQNNDDCWLDSGLYSMFGSTALADFFSNLLHNLHENADINIRNLSIHMRKYLVGLTNRDFSCNKDTTTNQPPVDKYGRVKNNGELCKQRYKDKIVNDIIQISTTLFDKNEWAVAAQFQKNEITGKIGNGSVGILFETIASLSDDILYIDPSQEFNWNCRNNIIDRKFIKSVVKKLGDIDTQSEIVIFDINGISPGECKDVSRLTELSLASSKMPQGNNYELLGIVFGIGPHYTSAVKCPRGEAGKWRKYDTGLSPPTICDQKTITGQNPANLIHENTFNYTEHVVLVYRKITHAHLSGGSIFNMITHPITGKKVNINSKSGSSILRKYIKQVSD